MEANGCQRLNSLGGSYKHGRSTICLFGNAFAGQIGFLKGGALTRRRYTGFALRRRSVAGKQVKRSPFQGPLFRSLSATRSLVNTGVEGIEARLRC